MKIKHKKIKGRIQTTSLILSVICVMLLGCGEVSWQRKYVVPIDIHLCRSDGAVAVVNIELPIDIKKQPDVKPNVPIDLSVPVSVLPKEFMQGKSFTLPDGTGSLILIWSAKRDQKPTDQPEKPNEQP